MLSESTLSELWKVTKGLEQPEKHLIKQKVAETQYKSFMVF